jgi:transcriptional regulator with XRE-family HTH domain
MIEYVREIRKKLGMTQVKLAEAIKVPEATVRAWESGRRNISVEFAKRIAQYATYAGIPTTLDDIYGMPKKAEKEDNTRRKKGS